MWSVTGDSTPGDSTISLEKITKYFGSFPAVREVSFSVPTGTIFGLLGANGAGKSTLIRILCGILAPSSGSAQVAGIDVLRDPDRIKQRIGYMSQLFSLYGDLTVRENLRLFAGIYGLFGAEARHRMDWARTTAELGSIERQRADELSGGYRQRLALACALMHAPVVLFLDEPTSGVDPLARRSFWETIEKLAAAGTTILVTTHYLEEAEYCHNLAMMHRGQVIARGSPRDLKQLIERTDDTPRLEDVFIALIEAQEHQEAQEQQEAREAQHHP